MAVVSRNKKERETLGASWKRRIKGMLFFDWNFPISNNKLKLQFPEGDLNTALNAKYVLPKPAAVIYPGVRGRNIQKEFREWLIKCHEVLCRLSIRESLVVLLVLFMSCVGVDSLRFDAALSYSVILSADISTDFPALKYLKTVLHCVACW